MTENRFNPETILANLPKDKKPPLHLWHPEREVAMDMRIARDGSWYHDGGKISRQRMVKLFSTILRKDDERYFLVTPMEKVAIVVEDAPFVAVEMTVHGQGREQVLTFRSNVDDEVMAGPDHRIRVVINGTDETPSPYIHIRDGLEALLTRAVFYELVDLAYDYIESTGDGELDTLGVWSAGIYFPLSEEKV
jgi:hypothetical protein